MKNEEIYRLLEDQGKHTDLKLESMEKTIRYGLKGVRQYVDAGFETIEKADKLRNGRIENGEVNIKEIKKDTAIFRWMHRNPIPSAAGFLIIIMLSAYGYHKINIKKTVENITKIELKDK